MRKKELWEKYNRAKADNEHLRAVLDDIKAANENGCVRGEWCGACAHFFLRQESPFYGCGVCAVSRCDKFKLRQE